MGVKNLHSPAPCGHQNLLFVFLPWVTLLKGAYPKWRAGFQYSLGLATYFGNPPQSFILHVMIYEKIFSVFAKRLKCSRFLLIWGGHFTFFGRAPYTFHKGLFFLRGGANERPLQISNLALQIIIPSHEVLPESGVALGLPWGGCFISVTPLSTCFTYH